MPPMMVWPVSSSVWTRKVGSSSDNAPSALAILSWSTLVLGSMATWMTGSGKIIFSRMIGCLSSQSVSPVFVSFMPMRGDDVAGVDAVDVLARVGVHLEQAAEALFLAGAGVEHLVALVEGARVDAEVGEPTDVGVAHDLERQRREGLVVGRLALGRLALGGLARQPGGRSTGDGR